MKPSDHFPTNKDEWNALYANLKQQLDAAYKKSHSWFQSQPQTTQYAIVAGATLTSYLIGHRLFRFSFRRLKNVDSVRDYHLKRQVRLKGIVPHVGDGDNFRFYHIPPMVPVWWVRLMSLAKYPRNSSWSPFQNGKPKKLKLDEYTLHVRLAGMDAPECAHFGQPGQVYGPIAKEYLTKLLTNQCVTIYPLRKDQYNRLVCSVYIRTWSHWLKLRPLNVSAHMIDKGLGVVYEGQGQVWSEGNEKHNQKMRQYLTQIQQRATKQKRGMWAKKATSVSPKDYKKEFK